ncbi:uncharacterized protein LOC108623375 [Ceratina calcarata]|uniref:Uncharacterized protein LOC108623375 n=2 Tax=Ceratina calcarata TaxID=156304 RepID=A0AAJ7RZ58_9HYME|nr:uncharacterized protein LOC108623375 [Ceratina calcarata]
MGLAVFCLLLLLRLGHSQDDLPSRYEVESSINRTIEEVERQIRENPSLPRLSRADIVKTLQNITSQDLRQLKDKEKLEKARNLYQRALMVVLPYNGESSGDLKDLYTKPPMTQMIPDDQGSENRGDEEDNEVQNSEITTENFYNRDSYKTTLKDLTTTNKNKYKNHKDTYSEVQTKIPLKETLKLDSTPVKFTFNLDNLQKNSYTNERAATTTTTTTRYPIYRSNGSTSELEIVYSTSVTEATTKPAPKEIAIDLGRFKEKQNILTSSQWRYNAPPTTFEPTLPSKVDRIPFLPTITVEPEERIASTEKSQMIKEALMMSTEKPTALYVTPMSPQTTTKTKYSSTYSLNSAGFRQATSTSTTSMPMRPEVMDLLASIGLRPDNNSNVEDVYKKNKDILELNNIRSTSLTPVTTDSMSIVDQNVGPPGSEIKKGVDNLSRDVQLLFKKFGLQTSDLDKSTSTTQRTTINLNSYTNFKPLPTSNVKDEGLKEFLASFGLIGDNRKQKSMRPTTEMPSLIEVVPDNMRGILENIGLISRKRKTVEDVKSTDSSKFHVFKPHEAKVQDEEQKNKINELLDTVKLMQEGKAGIQNVKQAASDLLQSTKVLKEGPDPVKLEEIFKTYEEDTRNEVKRQEDEEKSETTTTGDEGQTTTTEPAGETTLSPTTTDSARAASDQLNSGVDSSTTSSKSSSNLMALEESFGGTTKAPDTSLPPRRKSGLYFLVDWNTFLEVGEDEKEKINLRFQPKVGDRSRFLPVTVP